MKNMKKLLLIAGTVFLLVSCEQDKSVKTVHQRDNYTIVTIDDCEYIKMKNSAGYGGYGYLAHKGNCPNPIHCHNRATSENDQ
jgi:hypothetical protein